jgi:hypothetical protein
MSAAAGGGLCTAWEDDMIADTTHEVVRARPIGVVILAGLAGIELVLAVVHLAQAIGLLPYFIGPVAFRDFNLWYAMMWGLMVWVWVWAIRALLDLDPGAWMFVLIISGFSVTFDFITIIATPTETTDIAVSFFVGLAILVYLLLPGTKRAFTIQ